MGWLEDKGHDSMVVALIRRAVKDSGPKAQRQAAKLRKKHPELSTRELVERVDNDFKRLTVVEGAAAGAAAVMPGIGTIAALVLAAGEAGLFLFASARYILTRAALEDMDPEDFDSRLTLVMASMLGPSGVATASQASPQTERVWARTLAQQRSASRGKLQQGLGRTFISRYLIRKGAGIFGRLLPFGVGALIGGLANHAGSKTVIEGADAAFGHNISTL